MANIPSSVVKINDVEVQFEASLSEQLFTKFGATINGLIDAFGSNVKLNYQTFTSNGTFTAPASLKGGIVFLIGCGGGGGGGSGAGSSATNRTGGMGGDGAALGFAISPVTPSSGYSVTIGAGGTGGSGTSAASGNNGGVGDKTIFNGIEFWGGIGGRGGVNATTGGTRIANTRTQNFEVRAGGAGGGIGNYAADGFAGVSGIFFGGGLGGPVSTHGGGGGGGGGPFGVGGNGGTGGIDNATAAGVNTGAGGGGGCASTPASGNGRAGGSGKLYVIWLESST